MKQTLNFSKYHGLGNDFILIDGINQRVKLDVLKLEVPLLCDRNFGVGADGVIVALESKDCDIRMIVFNADGSIPEMCGNGLRCFSQFVYEQKLIEKEIFSVQTDAGKLVPALLLKDNKVIAVEVDMGGAQTDTAIMPAGTKVFSTEVSLDKLRLQVYVVSMGNPHAVVFVDDFKDVDLGKIGPYFQTLDQFPNGVNCEIVKIINRQHAQLEVWERGAGRTLACGTGACAAVIAGVSSNRVDSKVTVKLPGGTLVIEYLDQENKVIMTGPTKFVFSGKLVL